MAYTVSRAEVKTLIAQNIRTTMDDAAKSRLEASMNKDGQKFPILITKSGKILDGHRRVAIAMKLGWTHIDATVVDEDLTDEQIADVQTVHAFHSEALSDVDKARTLKAKKDSAGLTNKQLAEFYSIDPSEVTQLLSLFACIPAVIERAEQGRIGRTKWYAISQSEDQEETLRLHDSGATRDAIRRSVKKAKGAATPAVRASKIRCPLVSGAVVTVAAEELSLEEAIEAAGEAIKQMKAALAKGINAKTAMAYWKDVAAAG